MVGAERQLEAAGGEAPRVPPRPALLMRTSKRGSLSAMASAAPRTEARSPRSTGTTPRAGVPAAAKLVEYRSSSGLGAARKEELRPLGGERPGGGRPDAARCAGDDHSGAIQVCHGATSFLGYFSQRRI